MVDAYLSRGADGKYLLTSKPPILCDVDGIDKPDLYVAPGDALGLRHLCYAGVAAAGIKLKRFDTIKIELSFTPKE